MLIFYLQLLGLQRGPTLPQSCSWSFKNWTFLNLCIAVWCKFRQVHKSYVNNWTNFHKAAQSAKPLPQSKNLHIMSMVRTRPSSSQPLSPPQGVLQSWHLRWVWTFCVLHRKEPHRTCSFVPGFPHSTLGLWELSRLCAQSRSYGTDE